MKNKRLSGLRMILGGVLLFVLALVCISRAIVPVEAAELKNWFDIEPTVKCRIKKKTEDGIWPMQGAYMNDDYAVYTGYQADDSPTVVTVVDLNTCTVIAKNSEVSMGHANSITYDNRYNYFYVVSALSDNKVYEFTTRNGQIVQEGSFQTSMRFGALEYDSQDNRFFGYSDGHLYVSPASSQSPIAFATTQSHYDNIDNGTSTMLAQGIAYGNGNIYFARTISDSGSAYYNHSFIEVYDANNGEYKYVMHFPCGIICVHLEDLTVSGDKIFMGANSYYDPATNDPTTNDPAFLEYSGLYAIEAEYQGRRKDLYYNANNGTGAPAAQNCVASSSSASCSIALSSTAPTRSGYTFLGWADSASATSASYQPGGSITLSGDKTIYAVWKLNSVTRTLTFNANNGSGAPNNQTCTATGTNTSCAITISSTTPTRDGHTFLGWADSASATSASYQPGGSITLSGDKTIYAVWEKLIFDQTVSFAVTSVNKTYGDDSFVNLATTTGNGTITYASDNTNVAIIDFSTGAVTIKGVGTATITATASATADYHEGSASYTLTIAKANQTVSFSVSTITKIYNDSSFTNIATNNRTDGGTISYSSSNANVATVDSISGEVTIISAGTVEIIATAEATANYNTGTGSYTLVINPIAPTAYFENTEIVKIYGDDNFSNEVTTVSDGTVTYTSGNPAVATVIPSTGEVTIVGAGDATITASVAATINYEAITANYILTVGKKTSIIPEEAKEPRKGWITDTLSTITLDVDGLAWDNPETIIEEGSHFYRAKYTTNNDTTNYTTEYLDITVLGEHRIYTVVEGDGQTYQLDEETGDMVFKIDADYSLFERGGSVYIDEELLDKQFYDSESGSTIINIHHDYLETLETSEHTFAASFNDGGIATARFMIAEKEDEKEEDEKEEDDEKDDKKENEDEPIAVPDTGSNNGVVEAVIKSTGIAVLVMAISTVCCVCIYRNRQKKTHKIFD